MNRFYGLMSTAEAAELLGLKNDSSIRKAIAAGHFEEGKDCRKYGKQWIITLEALQHHYRYSRVKELYWNKYGRSGD